MNISDILKDIEEFFTPSETKEVKESLVPPNIDVMPGHEPTVIPYYPNQSYLEGKGKAPDTFITHEDMQLLTDSTKRAVEQGVIKPEIAKYIIPMLMTEGRPGNYGIREDQAHYASKRNKEIMTKMGLSIKDAKELMKEGGGEGEGSGEIPDILIKDITPATPKGYKGPPLKAEPHLMQNRSSPEVNAKLVTALLGIKSNLKGVKTEEDLIKKYNGKGSAIEVDYDGNKTPANVDVYWKKVEEARRMLDHPKNMALKTYYDELLNGRK